MISKPGRGPSWIRTFIMSCFFSAIAINSVLFFILYMNKFIDLNDVAILSVRNQIRQDAMEAKAKDVQEKKEKEKENKNLPVKENKREIDGVKNDIKNSINFFGNLSAFDMEELIRYEKLNDIPAWDEKCKYTILHHFVMRKYRYLDEEDYKVKEPNNYYSKVIQLSNLDGIVNIRANDDDTLGTPLHFLARPTISGEDLKRTELSNVIIFRDLIINGADINAVDAYGRTVYDLAIDQNLSSLVSIIESGFEKINGKWQRKVIKADRNGKIFVKCYISYHHDPDRRNFNIGSQEVMLEF